MLKSRSTKTLTILFLSVVVGSGILLLMETEPINVQQQSLTARVEAAPSNERLVFETSIPVQHAKWSNIVIKTSILSDDEVAQACHFVVDFTNEKVNVFTTDLWKEQSDGYHTYVPGRDWNSDSIGICVAGVKNISSLRKNPARFKSLMNVVRTLQHHMNITSDRVYLPSDLYERTATPSDAFLIAFSRNLLNNQ